MATLQGTSTTTCTVDTTITANTILCTAAYSVQTWAGSVYVPSGSAINIFANTNGYIWVTGILDYSSSTSYNSGTQSWFGLSRYGLKKVVGSFDDGWLAMSYVQDGGNPDISHMRLTNTSPYAGMSFIVARIFTGKTNNSITSSILTRVI